ncbi:MAG TPA: alpha/beta fold hydrolase [Anaerolineae bacterium]|nr:alpha/beta fold hydrolase [Anaerolineae bacterium]
MKEEVILLGRSKTLLGILTLPARAPQAAQQPAIILLNAGLIHRIGPNRIYVKLARRLADLGFTVLRFDLSGIGDSPARADHVPFEQSAILEVQDAMNTLAQSHGIREFLLMGHCSGAVNSFRAACQDARVVGAVLINPEGGNEQWTEYDKKRKVARYYQNYYGRGALADASRWRKLLSGQADYRSILRNLFRGIIGNKVSTLLFRLKRVWPGSRKSAQDPALAEQTIQGMRLLVDRGTRLLVIHSEGSSGREHLQTLLGHTLKELQATGRFKMIVIPQSDHLFTLLRSQAELFAAIEGWLTRTVTEYALRAIPEVSVVRIP